MRVATALPAATEIAYALGLDPVAVSHECHYPPAAAEKPRLSSCTIDAESSSDTIAAQLEADDVYSVHADVLCEADPDLVVTQSVCDLCALDALRVEDAVDELGLDCDVLSIDAHDLDAMLADVERIGAATGRADDAAALVADLRARIERVEREATAAVDARGRPRTLVLDWFEPLLVAGHWVPEMVALAGGAYGLTDPGAYSVPQDWERIVRFDPEVLVLAPCGWGVDHTLDQLDGLRTRPGWSEVTAVERGEVYVLDGDVLNCGSPRLVDALEHLAGILHPGRFDAPPDDAHARLADLPRANP